MLQRDLNGTRLRCYMQEITGRFDFLAVLASYRFVLENPESGERSFRCFFEVFFFCFFLQSCCVLCVP